MTQSPKILNSDLGKKSIRFVIALVGLLVLRAILGSLPMLTNASAFGNSLMSPLVLADAIVDTLIIVVILQFGFGLGRAIGENSRKLPVLGRIVTLAALSVALVIAYRQYETPVACLIVSPSDLSKIGQAQMNRQVEQFVSQMFQGVANAEVKMATGDTLAAFQRVAVVALRQPPDAYGWIFLALISLPLVGIVVLVSRNLDSFTEAVFHAASAAAGGDKASAAADALGQQCANCGQTIGKSKFCQHCGAPASAPTLVPTAVRICPSCGSNVPTAAKFCRECGKAA